MNCFEKLNKANIRIFLCKMLEFILALKLGDNNMTWEALYMLKALVQSLF